MLTGLEGAHLTKREFLKALGRFGGAAAVLHGMSLLGLAPMAQAAGVLAPLPAGHGVGRRVLILGAGVAGLCAAYNLTRAGYDVRVLEANRHIGGRSLTLRRGDTFQETDRPAQECRFDEGLYLNAGPGRIPHHHSVVLDYCRQLGVEMEPYIFVSRANLLQADNFNGGAPVQLRRIDADLRGQIAEMLAKVSDDQRLDAVLSQADRAAFRDMLREFGDLRPMPDGTLPYRGSPRGGYAVPPGAGAAGGTLNPHIAINELLASGLWNAGLYAELRHYWQASLLQPKGGMDQIIRGFLDAAIPGGRRLRDIVETRRPVTAIRTGEDGVVVVAGDREEMADYCISTMAPPRLAAVRNNFRPAYLATLNAFSYAEACKVGWQAKWRFWETQDQIYGGISWTTHEISQIWYPSDGHLGPTGVLTGAYNRGPAARAFGALPHEERLARALDGGERLHPGFTQWIHRDRGLSIAWQNMPFFNGGWAEGAAISAPDAYRRASVPEGRLYLAGDFLSHLPGWKEGALLSAHLAVEGIAGHSGNSWRAVR